MPSLKEFDVKLASLKNTRKMTKTMQMVSASKLRRAQEAQKNASRFAGRIQALTSKLAASIESASHPLLTRRQPVRNVLIIVFSSDKGLCAGFNNNLSKFVSTWIDEHPSQFGAIDLSFCGRRGFSFFKNRASIKDHYEDVTNKPDFGSAYKIAQDITALFLENNYDEIYIAYNVFKNALTQTPTLKQILPVEPQIIEGGTALSHSYIFEPTAKEILEDLLPKSVTFQLHYTLLENAAGEHGARMTAMDNATNNANKMIDHYTLLRNRARQAAITTEMIEIVSGAEALR
ncbi:MAG: ATP synthase F1 subunit gamma [Kiritimatiellae bacterium]|nr:ATP synthase F1 subunit gamma [Kiritimatiellia bacterium]